MPISSSSLLMPCFFYGMATPSAKICSERFMQKILNKNLIDFVGDAIQELFLEAEGIKQVKDQNKNIFKLDPEDLRDAFAIAHDLAVKSNQAERALFYQKEINKIEEKYGLESLNPDLKINNLDLGISKGRSMLPTIAKIVVMAAAVLGTVVFLATKTGVKNYCVDSDQTGYLMRCIKESQYTLSSTKCMLFNEPIPPAVKECMKFEENQQKNYEIMIEQQLSNNECLQSLETAKKLYNRRDVSLKKIVDGCKDSDIQEAAIELMSYDSSNNVRGAIVDQKLSQKDCQEAVRTAQKLSYGDKSDSFFKKILRECKDLDTRNSVTDYWSKSHRVECMDDCCSEYIRSIKFASDGSFEINDRPLKPVEVACIDKCASELTARKIKEIF